MRGRLRRLWAPLIVFAVCASVYVAVTGPERLTRPAPDNHFVYQAFAWLHGQMHVSEGRPPGDNDWAHFGNRWYVSFPPVPAAVILPAVAIWGLTTKDRLFWSILAGVAPALLFALLRDMRERKLSPRTVRDDLLLTALFAFGSVYFFTAVQGTVWFAAHVVACSLLVLYVWASLEATCPVLAGACIGLGFLTRTPMLFAFPLFLVESMSKHRRSADAEGGSPVPDVAWWRRVGRFVAGTDPRPVLRSLVLFSVPVAACVGIAMWMNHARFGNAFEFGHRFLEIRWRPRIDRWGLFNYHYLGRNLAVMLALLPWLQKTAPYLRISRHGLALWVTTPHYLLAPWPKATTRRYVALLLATLPVAALSLLYQNSGWIQFGYRFSLDYSVFLIAMLAIGGRRFGGGAWLLLAVAIAINTFGAVTFDRAWRYYDGDPDQTVLFQPD